MQVQNRSMQTDASAKCTILPREKWWWLGLGLLMLLAGWLYLRGYDVSLPYFAHYDEQIHVVAAQHTVDFGSARNFRNHDAYPPGLAAVNYLLLKHIKPPDAHHGSILPLARLINIAAWLAAAALVALLGCLLASELGGLLAAAIWIVNPWIIARAHFALPDGYLTLFTLLSLWLALVGCLHRRRSFSTAAMYSIMLAACFKTQALFVSPLILFLPLAGFGQSQDRSALLRLVFWNGTRLSLFLFWYILLTPILSFDQIIGSPVAYQHFALPSPQLLWQNLEPALRWFWDINAWLAMSLAGMLLCLTRPRLNRVAVITLSLAALAWLFGTSLFGAQHFRQYYALGAMLVLFYALGLSMLADFIIERSGRIDLLAISPKAREIAVKGLFCALLGIGLLPALQRSDELTYEFTLPDRRNDLARYMDASLPPGKYLAFGEAQRALMRDVGGYDGVHDFPWHNASPFGNMPIDEWRELGVQYAILPWSDEPDAYYPDETARLKSYPPDPSFRGPSMVVLRLYPMQNASSGQLGGIHLLGYDINANEFQPGDDIVFRHYWQAEAPTETAQHVFNHLLDAAGNIVAQTDYVPLWDARRPTSAWDDPDEILLGREFRVSLPSDLKPGEYQLISGFYDPETWQRLLAADGGDHIAIATVKIRQPAN